MSVKLCCVLALASTLFGCGKPVAPANSANESTSEDRRSPVGVARLDSEQIAQGYDPDARAELLRAGGGPFFIDPSDSVIEVRVFKPHEHRTYTLEEKDGYHVNLFMYVDAPQDLIDKVGHTEYGAPKVGLVKSINDKFGNEQIGIHRVSPILTGNSPWEIAVENLTDQPLLFQIVRSEVEMTEEVKAMHREMKANRQRRQ
jgi:hypothetical protein